MFRSVSGESRSSSGQSTDPAAGHGVSSPGLDSQESSWIGLLSAVSRPALSFLQRYLPGRARPPALRGELKSSFADEEREFLRQLDDMMPLTQHAAPHLTYLRCQHEGPAGLQEAEGGGAVPWLTAESFRELGMQSAEEVDLDLCRAQMGHLSSARTLLGQVWWSSVSSQDLKPAGGTDWAALSSPVRSGGGKSRTWWGSLWGGEGHPQAGLGSDQSWAEDRTLTARLCPQRPAAETKAPTAGAARVFVPSGGTRWTLGENTGATEHKEGPDNNGGLHTVQNTEGSTADHQLSISDHLRSSGAAAACSEAALLTPDQDNGYSSLEEEHVQMSHLNLLKAPSEPPQEPETTDPGSAEETAMEGETSEEGESTSGQEHEEEQDGEAQGAQASEGTGPPALQCQNKSIAFIMGCPCSDDDSSQSGDESSDDDDDGFDSEGSSDLSDSSDEDEEDEDEASDSDGEADSEAERLWSSLCQSLDPYNPRNFTAALHSSRTPPRPVPASTPPSSTQSSPACSPDLPPLPLSSLGASPPLPSSSPLPSSLDVWDDSTSASEVDEAESLRLWSSFSCSSDPYSPFNFQAPLRTQGPVKAGPRARTKSRRVPQTGPQAPHCVPAASPESRRKEAEERLDSGFSEPSTSSFTSSSTRSCCSIKKVRFCDDVEEFFASCGEEEEDRRGPWEELARDRCRFLRRCQEVEQSIAYCLQPQHRSLVYGRLTVLHLQDP